MAVPTANAANKRRPIIDAPKSVIDTRARKGVIGGYTTYPQLRNRASSIAASSSRWNPYWPLVAVCSATTNSADRTRMPVSLAMILWQVADSRIDIEITITLTTERRIVPLGLEGNAT